MMYHQRKTETKVQPPSSRVPGASVLKQTKTETLLAPNTPSSRPSKSASVPTSSTGAVEGKVSFAANAKLPTVKPEARKLAPAKTVKTTVTTFTTKPRLKPEKPSAPLFNVTNYHAGNRIGPGPIAKVPPSSAAPSRPSRVLVASTSSARGQSSPNPKPPPTAKSKSVSTPASLRGASQNSQLRGRQIFHKEMPIPILKKTSTTTVKDIRDRPIPPECVRCDVCMRGFLPDRLEKHREACRKLESRPTKVFNATAMRTAGTELESYIKRGAHQKDVPVKKSNWRAKHEEFLNNVREAKKVQDHLARGGKLSDLPPPRRSENPDYIQCPHCSRKFNESAAERHIPKCANILSNKKKPVSTAKNKR